MKIILRQIVKITDLFPKGDYNNRLDLIKNYDKSDLLKILSSINCFPGKHINLEYTDQDHEDILSWLFSDESFFSKWKSAFLNLTRNKSFPVVFHRAANLVAIEEILSNDFSGTKGVNECSDVEAFLKYYLSINSLINNQQQFNTTEGINDLEIFISGISATNELDIPFFPDQDILRYQELIDYLCEHDEYGKYVNDYFKSIGVSKEYYGIWGLSYIIPIQQSKMIHPPICVASKKRDKVMLARFSGDILQPGHSPLETLNVKKNPFWNIGDGKFLLLDIQFLIDKCYHSLINDLWFDHLKPKGLNRASFMGVIGYFFEEYIGRKFKECHPKWRRPPIMVADELKTKIGKNEIELADVYLRHSKKVLVGQIKVSAINSKDKYTFNEGGIFRINRNEFYKTFGLTQMVENTIHHLVNNSTLFDENFPSSEKVEIYPILIVNERLLLNPTMNLIFQDYFIEQMKDHFVGDIQAPIERTGNLIVRQRFIVKPIVILYVAELELLQIHISEREYRFWEILDNHVHETSLNVPMTYTINNYIGKAYLKYFEYKVFPVLSRLVSGCFFPSKFLLKFWDRFPFS